MNWNALVADAQDIPGTSSLGGPPRNAFVLRVPWDGEQGRSHVVDAVYATDVIRPVAGRRVALLLGSALGALGRGPAARSAAAGRRGRLRAPAQLPTGAGAPPATMDWAGHRLAPRGPRVARAADPCRRQRVAQPQPPARGPPVVA